MGVCMSNDIEQKVFKKMMVNIGNSSRQTKIFSNTSYLRGRKKELEVDITWQDLQDQYNKQGGKCYWFNLPLNLEDSFISWHPLACSCDRLDNSKGYLKDNIVISCRFANLGRGAASTELFENSLKRIKDSVKNNQL
jgi:hypothetical protein